MSLILAFKITHKNPEFYVMKHFSHFIKKGAVRIEAQGSWTGNTVAFRNPGGYTVIVLS